MQKYGFSLTHILPYKNRSADSVLIRENTVSENLYSRIFYAVFLYLILSVLFIIPGIIIQFLHPFYHPKLI